MAVWRWPAEVIHWAVQILSALDYLHELKPPIVHREHQAV